MNILDTHITVAIDGPSGAGKSTIARAAARRFGLIYVDTGAIYRTVGLACERAGADCSDTAAVQVLLPEPPVELPEADEPPQLLSRPAAAVETTAAPPTFRNWRRVMV